MGQPARCSLTARCCDRGRCAAGAGNGCTYQSGHPICSRDQRKGSTVRSSGASRHLQGALTGSHWPPPWPGPEPGTDTGRGRLAHWDQMAALLPLPLGRDPLDEYGGELWHCGHDLVSCCLGYWCPCWLFGRNLQRAGICRHTVSGCCGYVLFSSALALCVGALSVMNNLWFVECITARAEEHTFSPCRLAEGGEEGQPACSHSDIELMSSSPDSIFIQQSCQHCVALMMGRLSEQQMQQMLDQAVQSELLCAERQQSRSRLVELVGLVGMGLFGGAFRERIRASFSINDEQAGQAPAQRWWSFGVHCCPLTHQLALCQESRAAELRTLGAAQKHAGD
jgi:hypothetical protein